MLCNLLSLNRFVLMSSFLVILYRNRSIQRYILVLQLQRFDSIVLLFPKSSKLDISFIQPGEEIFLAADIWPDLPPTVRIRKRFSGVLVLLKKIIRIQERKICENREGYIYSGKYMIAKINAKYYEY